MRLSRFQIMAGVLGSVVLTITGVGIAGTASAAAPRDARCAKPLPGSVIGAPAVKAGAASGTRVWHDKDGWHLRVTHPGSHTEVFTGTVHSPQPITLRGRKLEKGDSITLSDGGHTMTYRFVNHGAVDGVDFTDRCAINTSFNLQRDGALLPTSEIFLGAGGAHPTANPFLVQRYR